MVSSCGLAGPAEPLSWGLSRDVGWLLQEQREQQAAGRVPLQAWRAVSRGSQQPPPIHPVVPTLPLWWHFEAII